MGTGRGALRDWYRIDRQRLPKPLLFCYRVRAVLDEPQRGSPRWRATVAPWLMAQHLRAGSDDEGHAGIC